MTWGGYLSPEAEKAKEDAAIRSRISYRRMQAGPYLAEDGTTVVVPSEPGYYRKSVVAFWKGQGYRWDGDRYAWVRNARRSGRPAAECLQEARAAYYRLWPKWAETSLGPDSREKVPSLIPSRIEGAGAEPGEVP